MSSSDSETFESADEDFVDDIEVPRTKLKGFVKHHYDSSEAVAEGIQKTTLKSIDVSNKIASIPISVVESSNLTVEAVTSNNIKEVEKNEIVQLENIKVPPSKVDNERQEKSDTLKCPGDIGDQSSPNFNENTESLPMQPNIECTQPSQTDGWDFDDWGDYDDNIVDPILEKPKKTSVSATTSDKKSEIYSEEGWEFDGWDEEEPAVNNINKSTGADLYFPVLGEISPHKENKPNSGIIGNFSKFISAGSSYDTFPVLNQLGLKSKSNENDKGVILNENKDKNICEKTYKEEVHNSNWGWKPWGGVVSLLSTASDGVASLTSHVSSVIESGIGIPDPVEIAKLQREKEVEKLNNPLIEENRKKEDKSINLGNIVTGVTHISSRVITGGLDTLEGIGKKTMTILQENDPGLMNKRKMLGLDKQSPVLSQILREAKSKTEEAERNLKQMQKQQYKKQLHFETLFDDHHGLVHLEALEMLSSQSSIKLQTLLAPLTGLALDELQETLNEVKELCELPEQENEDADGNHSMEDLSEKLTTSVEDLNIPMDFNEICQCWKESTDWIQDTNQPTAQNIHDKALRCLAQTTALAVNKMHKLAELLLIKERHSTANEADGIVQLTNIICWHLSGIATKFGNALSHIENEEEANSFITSIFLEGSNSTSYIQNAFQLFIPILQIGAA